MGHVPTAVYFVVSVPSREKPMTMRISEGRCQDVSHTIRRFDSIKPLWEGLDRGAACPLNPSIPVMTRGQVLNGRPKEIIRSEYDESWCPPSRSARPKHTNN